MLLCLTCSADSIAIVIICDSSTQHIDDNPVLYRVSDVLWPVFRLECLGSHAQLEFRPPRTINRHNDNYVMPARTKTAIEGSFDQQSLYNTLYYGYGSIIHQFP